MKSSILKALKFGCCVLPLAVAAGIGVAYYTLHLGLAQEALATVSKQPSLFP